MRIRRVLTPRRILGALVVGYVAAAVTLSALRLLEFQSGNWDLGIAMQAMWSTYHGYPLYEAGDYAQFGATSWFEIHPSLVPVALTPLYAMFPSAFTLFIVQSTVVGAAAFPLYLIARDLTSSESKALLSAALYLVWPPILAANIFDFHLEAFLPLELFTLFLLWERGRYRTGAAVGVLAFVTLEIGPVLVASMMVFFLFPAFRDILRKITRSPQGSWAEPGARELLSRMLQTVLPWVRTREVRASLLLGVGAVVAYALLRVAQVDPTVVLLGPVPVPGNPSVSLLQPESLELALGKFGVDPLQRVGYWVVIYALVAFLPWRAASTQIMAIPWMINTFFGHITFSQFGLQYGFIVVVPVLLGFIYGIRDLELVPLGDMWPRASSRAPLDDGQRLAQERPRPHLGRGAPMRSPSWFTMVAVILLLTGMLAGPADPLVQTHAPEDGYDVSYALGPGYAAVQALVQEMPSGATVLASNDLFPFVANDVHAYSLLWTPTALPDLPFNSTHLPPYALLSTAEASSIPVWLSSELTQLSVYRVVGIVLQTPAGTVTLYISGSESPTAST